MLSWEAAFALTSWLTPSSDAECTQSSKKTPSRLSRSGCRALSAVNFRKKLQSSCEVISTSMKQVPCCVSCRSHVQATPSSFQDWPNTPKQSETRAHYSQTWLQSGHSSVITHLAVEVVENPAPNFHHQFKVGRYLLRTLCINYRREGNLCKLCLELDQSQSASTLFR